MTIRKKLTKGIQVVIMNPLLLFTLTVWSGSILYSCFRVIMFSRTTSLHRDLLTRRHPDSLMTKIGFQWQDISDFEWITFKGVFLKHWTWILIYMVMSFVSGSVHVKTRYQVIFLSVYTMLFLVFVLNTVSLVVLLSLTAFVILTTLAIKSMDHFIVKLIPYIVFLLTLLTLHSDVGQLFKTIIFNHDDHKALLFDVCITWFSAKSLSFTVDCLRNKKLMNSMEETLAAVLYLFYFPSFLTGPVHLFKDFLSDLKDKRSPSSTPNPVKCTLKMLRIVLYCLLFEFLLHFIHTHALHFSLDSFGKLDGWTFCGLGYSLTCLFYIKYYVLYGFSNSLASLNGVSLPLPPQCVSRTCQSTSLWRTFDRGLYSWLIEYFYRPILLFGEVKRNLKQESLWTKEKTSSPVFVFFLKVKQVFASFLCFSCVCLWHRADRHIILWCCFNLASVLVEKVVNEMLDKKLLWKSIVSAPLFTLMVISNIFFLSNFDFGFAFLDRIFLKPYLELFVPLMVVMFSGCHVSFFLEQLDQERKTNDRRRVMFSDEEEEEQHLL